MTLLIKLNLLILLLQLQLQKHNDLIYITLMDTKQFITRKAFLSPLVNFCPNIAPICVQSSLSLVSSHYTHTQGAPLTDTYTNSP